MTESIPRIIDVEKQFKTHLPDIYHKLPRSFLRLIRHIVYEKHLNNLIHKSRDLDGIELVNWALEQFQITVKLKGLKNISKDGRSIFVANHPLAAQAGMKTLNRGGNAVDAMISVAFSLGVAEPSGSSIGGDGFVMIHMNKKNSIEVANGTGAAPYAATATKYSGAPFPFPILVSAGLAVTGLSGNILIHIIPIFRTTRDITIRDASICRAVTQPGSIAFNP